MIIEAEERYVSRISLVIVSETSVSSEINALVSINIYIIYVYNISYVRPFDPGCANLK